MPPLLANYRACPPFFLRLRPFVPNAPAVQHPRILGRFRSLPRRLAVAWLRQMLVNLRRKCKTHRKLLNSQALTINDTCLFRDVISSKANQQSGPRQPNLLCDSAQAPRTHILRKSAFLCRTFDSREKGLLPVLSGSAFRTGQLALTSGANPSVILDIKKNELELNWIVKTESWPRHSSLLSPSRIRGTTFLGPMYRTIPRTLFLIS